MNEYTKRDYRKAIEQLAVSAFIEDVDEQEIAEQLADYECPDICLDALHEAIDGSTWVIYYHAALAVHQHSDNESAIYDYGDPAAALESAGSIPAFLCTCAYYATYQDVIDLIGESREGIEAFWSGYTKAAAFSTYVESSDLPELPLPRDAAIDDLPGFCLDMLEPDSLVSHFHDCVQFFFDQQLARLVLDDDERAGNLFWYAREGHGITWTDGGWDEPLFREAQKASQAFGPGAHSLFKFTTTAADDIREDIALALELEEEE